MERELKSPLRKRRDRIVREIENWIYFCAGCGFIALMAVAVSLIFRKLGVA